MAKGQSAYAKAGVDYTKIQPFKDAMKRAAKETVWYPNKRGVFVIEDACLHGGTWEYRGPGPVRFCNTTEGLGNKNWLAEWMQDKTRKSYYHWIGMCTARMATNDVIAQGALPVVYTDEVAAGDSEWFSDEVRAYDFANGMRYACHEAGMALVAGESPALKYLVQAKPPVKSAPVLSGTVTGIITDPERRTITGKKLAPGDAIIGIESNLAHANGYSLMFKEALKLPDQFLTKLPSGKVLGKEMLEPTACYVRAIEALLNAELDIHALLPATGDGVAKLGFDKRAYTYVVTHWPQIPELFHFFYELLCKSGEYEDPEFECLKTFNCGVGYYVFLPERQVDVALSLIESVGRRAWRIGEVRDGPRQTIWALQGDTITMAPRSREIILPPPGE